MVEFTGKMLDGRRFFGRMKDLGMKDLGLNTKRHWYSARFSIKPNKKPWQTFYSRVDADLAAASGDQLNFRLAEDMACLEAHGVNPSTITIHQEAKQ